MSESDNWRLDMPVDIDFVAVEEIFWGSFWFKLNCKVCTCAGCGCMFKVWLGSLLAGFDGIFTVGQWLGSVSLSLAWPICLKTASFINCLVFGSTIINLLLCKVKFKCSVQQQHWYWLESQESDTS